MKYIYFVYCSRNNTFLHRCALCVIVFNSGNYHNIKDCTMLKFLDTLEEMDKARKDSNFQKELDKATKGSAEGGDDDSSMDE